MVVPSASAPRHRHGESSPEDWESRGPGPESSVPDAARKQNGGSRSSLKGLLATGVLLGLLLNGMTILDQYLGGALEKFLTVLACSTLGIIIQLLPEDDRKAILRATEKRMSLATTHIRIHIMRYIAFLVAGCLVYTHPLFDLSVIGDVLSYSTGDGCKDVRIGIDLEEETFTRIQRTSNDYRKVEMTSGSAFIRRKRSDRCINILLTSLDEADLNDSFRKKKKEIDYLITDRPETLFGVGGAWDSKLKNSPDALPWTTIGLDPSVLIGKMMDEGRISIKDLQKEKTVLYSSSDGNPTDGSVLSVMYKLGKLSGSLFHSDRKSCPSSGGAPMLLARSRSMKCTDISPVTVQDEYQNTLGALVVALPVRNDGAVIGNSSEHTAPDAVEFIEYLKKNADELGLESTDGEESTTEYHKVLKYYSNKKMKPPEKPISMAIVLDASSSMYGSSGSPEETTPLTTAIKGIRSFTNRSGLLRGDDKLMLVLAQRNRKRWVVPQLQIFAREDLGRVQVFLGPSKSDAHAGTGLLDSLKKTRQKLSPAISETKVAKYVVFITDGVNPFDEDGIKKKTREQQLLEEILTIRIGTDHGRVVPPWLNIEEKAALTAEQLDEHLFEQWRSLRQEAG
ncbi:MAG: hypothetical protein QG608_2577 [Actinomycetota bacterium]|nr:hypothetical protein [Actinomycetota bacterium]